MRSLGFYLFILYMLSYFLRFAARWPLLSRIQFDFLLAGALFVILLFSIHTTEKPQPSEISRFLKILFIYIILSLPLVKWPGSVVRYNFELYLKAFIFFIFTVSFVNSPKRLRSILWIFLGCQVIRILEPVYLHLTEGYWGSSAYSMASGSLTSLDRLSSAPNDVLNPTQFAGLIVTTLPFIYFLLFKSQKRVVKLFSVFLMPVFLYALFLTGARSGLICLLVVIVTIILNEFNKKINFKMLFVSGVVLSSMLLVSFTVLPDQFQERYLSIIDSGAVGADTAQGRIRALKTGFMNLFTGRIFFGYGLGTSAEANYHMSGYAVRSHSFYIETIQELGIIGFLILVKYIQAIFVSLKATKAKLMHHLESRENDFFLFNLTKALHSWALMFLVYCIICFGLSSWEWYFFGAVTALCWRFSTPPSHAEA